MRAFDIASTLPWAITEPALRQILEIAARENASVEAVEAQLGRRLDGTRTVSHRDGVALVPVRGPIFRRANMFTEISGATSIEVLAKDFTSALSDPSIHSIVLDIDSPGGEVTGVSEFADMIHAARGAKPLVAYVDGLGCSAAYWLASAADEIVCDQTSALGSIGVVLAVSDPTKASARDIEFVSSQSPDKRPDPTSERGRSQIQQTVDALADVFVASVARNRGVSPETVLSDFGQGGIKVGKHAAAAGLADRLGSLEGVIAQLQANHKQRPMPGYRRATMSGQKTDQELQAELISQPVASSSEVDELRKQFAAELSALRASQRASEEKRITAEASAFVAGLRGQILPIEMEAYQAAYIAAALDDLDTPRTVAFGGTTGNRIDLLKWQVSQRPPHHLTSEVVPVSSPPPTLPAGSKPEMSTERRAELLSLSSIGQATLKQQTGGR